MCKKIIVLCLVIGLMQIAGFNRNSFAEEDMIKETTIKTQDLKTLSVKEEIAVGKEDVLKKKQGQTYQAKETIGEIAIEEAEEVGGYKKTSPRENVKEIKDLQKEKSIFLPAEEITSEMPPLILNEQEEIKFNPSIINATLRGGGGVDYTTIHSGISKRKYLTFDIYESTDEQGSKSEQEYMSELMTKGKKVFSQQIETEVNGNFSITYQSTQYQQGNYYLIVSGRDNIRGGDKIIHFVRISPLSTKESERGIYPPEEPVKPTIIKVNP
ncbi:MAG: hypothetical protein AB1414_07990 [bacterium]